MTRALFISDLHLSGERPDASEQFFSFLGNEASRAQALYVLGDLFEYWAGDDELGDPAGDPLAAQVAQALRRLADAGVPVHVMHGNRDFLVGEQFLATSGARFLEDPSVIRFADQPVALLHGDTLCTDDLEYQAFRLQVRNLNFQREFLAQPLAERKKKIEIMRAKSEATKKIKPEATMDVTAAAVEAQLRNYGYPRLIHGHTHKPAMHQHIVDDRCCERWVLADWYASGSYLRCDAQGCRVVKL